MYRLFIARDIGDIQCLGARYLMREERKGLDRVGKSLLRSEAKPPKQSVKFRCQT